MPSSFFHSIFNYFFFKFRLDFNSFESTHYFYFSVFNNYFALSLSSMATWWCCSAMAARFAMVRSTGGKMGSILGFRRWMHSVPQSPPLAGIIDNGVPSSQPVLPEFSSPSSSFGGSMELMAVPKRKVRCTAFGFRVLAC